MDYSGNVFLVGPMGVGKTTIGRALAERMNLEFFVRIRRLKRPPAQIFPGFLTLRVNGVSDTAK